MTNPIQKIIEEAKAKGYVPEKNYPHTYSSENSEIYDAYSRGFNACLDSYNLEKIIELAYEKWIEEIREKLKEIKVYSNRKEFESKLGLFHSVEDIGQLLTNLSPNKECDRCQFTEDSINCYFCGKSRVTVTNKEE